MHAPRPRLLMAVGPAFTRTHARTLLEHAGFATVAVTARTEPVGAAVSRTRFDAVLLDALAFGEDVTRTIKVIRESHADLTIVVSAPTGGFAGDERNERVVVSERGGDDSSAVEAHVQAVLVPLLRTAVAVPLAQPRVSLVAMAASTGGPTAIETVLSGLKTPLPCPLLIVQHMPESVAAIFEDRLARVSCMPVSTATDGDPLQAGRVYLAPSDRHLVVDTSKRARLLDTEPVKGVRPAADVLFSSMSQSGFARHAIAVLLTGMGVDGVDGARRIVQSGGTLLCQDEASSVVWGMPGAAVRANLASAVVPLAGLAAELARRTGVVHG